MEATKNTPAIILGREPYRESDCLVSVYTLLDGKQVLVARGAKKLHSKLAGHIEPLTLADIMIVKGRGRDYLGSAIGRIFYSGIKSDLNKLYYAGQALSLFSRLVKEGETDENLFLLLSEWLEFLDRFDSNLKAASQALPFSQEAGDLFLVFFFLKLLTALGYKPEMVSCLSCGHGIKPDNNYFNLQNGGVVCSSCSEAARHRPGFNINLELLPISDNCVKLMRFILSNQLAAAEKLKVNEKLVKELLVLINNFIKFQF